MYIYLPALQPTPTPSNIVYTLCLSIYMQYMCIYVQNDMKHADTLRRLVYMHQYLYIKFVYSGK